MHRIAIAAAVLGGFLLTTNALTAPAAAFETTWNGVKVEFPDLQNADACFKEAGGRDASIAACVSESGMGWDRRLNAAFNELRRDLPAKDFAQLQAFQRLWIADREATCRGMSGEGTAAHIFFAECHLRLTAERAVALERRAGIKTNAGD